MKKILSIALVAVALTISLSSCNQKGGAASSALTDSIAMKMGELFGTGYGQQLMADSTMNKTAFIKGLEKIMGIDATDNSYVAGLSVGMQLLNQLEGLKEQTGVAIDKKLLMDYFEKNLTNGAVDQNKMMELNGQVQEMIQRASAQLKLNDPKVIAKQKDGEEYLKKMVADSGFTKTASGLAYKVINEGAGKQFTDSDKVMIKYVGKHVDGSEFDSSHGQPRAFSTDRVVPGFAEMIKLMKPGMKVIAILPPELAYGETGSGANIDPNETLVFEMETVGLQDPNAAPKPGGPRGPRPAPGPGPRH